MKFAALSRKQERFGNSSRVIHDIYRDDQRCTQDPRVFLAYAKHIYAVGPKTEAYQLLKTFCEAMSVITGLQTDYSAARSKPSALCDLYKVVQYFSVADLLKLQRQMKLSAVAHHRNSTETCDYGPDSPQRFMSNSLIQSLVAADLFCPLPEMEAKQYFLSLGLTPSDVNLLLVNGHLKVSQ